MLLTVAALPPATGLLVRPVCLLLGHLGAVWPGSPQLKQIMLVAAWALDVGADVGRRV